MKCFKCGKGIRGLRSFLPLERPYVNLPFHRDCYKSIEDELAYVTEHYDRIMEYIASRGTVTDARIKRLVPKYSIITKK
jgi:hypothetical protein